MENQNFSKTITDSAKAYASKWYEGIIDLPQKSGNPVHVRFQVKVYATGSDYGINEGRISKMWLGIDGETVAHYDRGWDTRPTCEEAKLALDTLLKDYR